MLLRTKKHWYEGEHLIRFQSMVFLLAVNELQRLVVVTYFATG